MLRITVKGSVALMCCFVLATLVCFVTDWFFGSGMFVDEWFWGYLTNSRTIFEANVKSIISLTILFFIIYQSALFVIRAHEMNISRRLFLLHLRACVRLQLPLQAIFDESKGQPAYLRKMFYDVSNDLKRGLPLADALDGHWQHMPPWVSEMVHLGEDSGALPEMLDKILDADQESEHLRSRLVETLLYPAAICLPICMTGCLFYFKLAPMFSRMFSEMNVLQMQSLWSNLDLANYILVGVGILAVFVYFTAFMLYPFPYGWNWETHCSFTDRFVPWLYRLRRITPWGYRMYRQGAIARWAITTGFLLKAGSPLPEAMECAGDIDLDPYFSKHTDRWLQHVKNGGSLTEALDKTPFVPRSLVWQVTSAEGTETLPAALQQGAMALFERLSRDISLLLKALSPLFILLIGYAVFLICHTFFSAIIATTFQALEAI